MKLFVRAIKELIPFRRTRMMEKIVFKRTKGVVQSGPFCGMQYLSRSHIHSAYSPKLLGIYEREISGPLEEALSVPYSRIVDIGAGEGYYAVGLALRMKNAHVIAYETESSAQILLSELAQMNNVQERITILGCCTKESLSMQLRTDERALLICDAEGAELILLDPIRIPALRQTSIFVELHEGVMCGLSEEIHERFVTTHDIQVIPQETRERSEFPYRTWSTRLLPGFIDYATDERRSYSQSWYWLKPKPESESTVVKSIANDAVSVYARSS